jgi:AraC-like DNA-binding protein
MLQASGHTIAYGIRFYPYGLSPFLPIPMQEFVGQRVDLVDLFGTAGHDLIVRLAAGPCPCGFDVLEHFLTTQLRDQWADLALIQAASQRLYNQRGAVSIAQMAASLYLSERSLERKFLLTTGLTPKALARVIRFNHIKNQLMLRPQQSLTTLAAQSFYFDQAHFIHDFEQFMGMSPFAFTQKVEAGAYRFYK